MSFINIKKLGFKRKIKDENRNIIGEKNILDNINIDIEQGEFVAIIGKNGSGKSTLARHLNALLVPKSESVYIDGKSTNDVENLWEIRKSCGMVFQNPDNQLVGATVEEDIAFGPENLGIVSEKIVETVENSLETVEMKEYRYSSVNKLSGGQKQRVAVAASLAMKPRCIVLDEPTAMLDPKGRREVMNLICNLNQEENITLILITHHMEEVILAKRVLVLDDGQIKFDGTPKDLFKNEELIINMNLELPEITELSYKLYKKKILRRYDIFDIKDFISQFENDSKFTKDAKIEQGKVIKNTGENDVFDKTDIEYNEEKILKVENLNFSFSDEKQTLEDINLVVNKGDFIGVIGQTGSGKTTLMQIFAGLIKNYTGKVFFKENDIESKELQKEIHFNIGYVFQNPENQLFEETVLKDVMFGPLNQEINKEGGKITSKGKTKDKAKDKAKHKEKHKVTENTKENLKEKAKHKAVAALKLMDVKEECFEKSPFALSGGEMRRVAIAGVLAMNPEILILDEPAAGLDPASKNKLMRTLSKINSEKGITIIMVSHNMSDVAKYTNKIIALSKGKIVINSSTREAFSDINKINNIGLKVPEVVDISAKLFNDLEKFNGISGNEKTIKISITVDELVEQFERKMI